jgi:hypothetical protein
MIKWKIHPKTKKEVFQFRWKMSSPINSNKIERKLKSLLKATEIVLPEKLFRNYMTNFEFNHEGQQYLFLNIDDDSPSGGLYLLVKL